jgi:hypothetical protein
MTINNNNIFGAFTLGEVRSGRLTGDWLNVESVANYGWFGGGFISTFDSISTVDRIDFSNDSVTASPRGPLSVARVYTAATGNSNYGWFGAGGDVFASVYYSLVDRVDFSNDSARASVRGPLASTRYGLAVTGNSNYGWFGGGRNAGFYAPIAAVERIDFSNDSTTASLRGPLTSSDPFGPQTYGSAATGNSNYGWFGGGYVTSPTLGTVENTTVNRIDFSNDLSPASVRGPLSSARGYAAATGNSNYGWFGGGAIPTPAAPSAVTPVSTVDRIDFSNDSSTTLVRGPLTLSRNALGATGNSNYGWFGGGGVALSAPIALASRVDRIDFSNDSVTALTRGSLTSENVGNYATSGVLNIRRQKAGNFGWFGGGLIDTVDRIDFSNDSSTASVRGPLSSTRYRASATGNSNYGWFGGGGFPTLSTVDRIDFSNDSSTASVRGPLSLERRDLAATGNSNYGWFGGGSGPVATVERINFSNDSSTASPRGSLSSSRYGLAATGNSNYGWFGGGYLRQTRVDRINFSNDSSTASVRSPLSSSAYGLAATGNSNYGWFGGGTYVPPGPDPFTFASASVDRIDFSNDSVQVLVRGPLSVAREYLAATGNSNYGWFGGGSTAGPNPIATVDRINFSNDSVTASVRGPLSDAIRGLAATSNTHIG